KGLGWQMQIIICPVRITTGLGDYPSLVRSISM
ncbi:uncharacterized protein METZ01_LOCUS443672, partial [marine metagenome]